MTYEDECKLCAKMMVPHIEAISNTWSEAKAAGISEGVWLYTFIRFYTTGVAAMAPDLSSLVIEHTVEHLRMSYKQRDLDE